MNKRFFNVGLFDETGLEEHTVKSLRLVILGVAFGTISFNINGGVAMTGYLTSLGASDFTFGLLYAIGPLAAPLQLLASYILERTRKRKSIFLAAGIIQRMSWLPFGLVPFFIPMDQPVLRIWTASLFLLTSACLVPFVNVTFFSLAADLVPMNIRGSYFAVRSRIATMFGVAGGILTAWFLDAFTGANSYAFVFSLAAAAGTLDIICFFGVKFPEMAKKPAGEKPEKFTAMMSGVIKNKGYMKFIIFMTLWQFSVNLSGPFFLVYLKNIVSMSNTLITVLIQILPSICSIIAVKRWGRAIDLHGNKSIMHLSAGILSVAPFMWIFVPANIIAAPVIVIISLMQGGLASGFDIGVNNIMLGHAPKENRSMYIAVYFMATSMLGVGAANAAGGWLLENIFSIFERFELVILGVRMTRYNYIFALTAVLRCAMIYIALPRLIREENNTPVRELLRIGYERVKYIGKIITKNTGRIM
ncbi:MAG: MFS transporter [Oscillospiraceae bacterium]|nr:MFS transporter [Oscillospiraceae bacterium]